MGDPDRLQQVVWNLLSNAIKFTPRGGRVQVGLARVRSHVEITVSDSGQGIAPELLPHVFERFHQGDSSSTRRHGGLGIGLALVRHLTELHGGGVSVHSAGVGQGATFTVRLPISLAAETLAPIRVHPAISDAVVAVPGVSLSGVRLLLVDDERDTLDLFRHLLARTGAEIETATSVAEAMTRFEQQPPDVLVADVEMPEEDGYALIRHVRSLDPAKGAAVPAVAVTAYGRVEDRVRLLAAGFNMHVPKPVEPAELVAVIAALARRPPTNGGPRGLLRPPRARPRRRLLPLRASRHVAERGVALAQRPIARAGGAVAPAAGRADEHAVAPREDVLLAVVDAAAVDLDVAAPAGAAAGQARRGKRRPLGHDAQHDRPGRATLDQDVLTEPAAEAPAAARARPQALVVEEQGAVALGDLHRCRRDVARP